MLQIVPKSKLGTSCMSIADFESKMKENKINRSGKQQMMCYTRFVTSATEDCEEVCYDDNEEECDKTEPGCEDCVPLCEDEPKLNYDDKPKVSVQKSKPTVLSPVKSSALIGRDQQMDN